VPLRVRYSLTYGRTLVPVLDVLCSWGQRTFETRSLYLILAEKLFTLPAADEMLPQSALFAGKYREARFAGLLGHDLGLTRTV
jgi:HxlR-like helix-turn-helix